MALQVHAADFAAAVVQVEIAGKFGVLGGHLHGFGIGEVFLHVGARAEESLFLAAPQADAHGAVELQVERLQDAHHLDHDGAAGAVVGGAGAGVPGIEVRADHHDLVLLVAAGNLADDVQAVDVAVRRSGFEVQAHAYGVLFLQQPGDPVVLFGGDHEGGRGGRGGRFECAGSFAEEQAFVRARSSSSSTPATPSLAKNSPRSAAT